VDKWLANQIVYPYFYMHNRSGIDFAVREQSTKNVDNLVDNYMEKYYNLVSSVKT